MKRADEILEVRVDAIALDGDGVARVDDGAVFVPGAAPGELVRVRVPAGAPGKARRRQATLLQVLEPSPDRVTPPCPLFGRCGGCRLQHLSYEAQCRAKRAALEHALGRAVDAFVPARTAWGTRARVRLHVAHGRAGLHGLGSHHLVELDACPVLVPAIDAALRSLVPALARALGGPAELSVDRGEDGRPVLFVSSESPLPRAAFAALEALVADGHVGGVAIGNADLPGLTLLGRPVPWTTSADGGPMRLAPGAFAQANPEVTAQLGAALLAGLEPRPDDRVLELYAGSGTFTLALAPHVGELVAVESVPEACRALEDNARARGQGSVRAVCADAEEHARRARGSFALVVLDPPRAGAPPGVLEAIALRKPRRVGYVSCDPRSLGRDLARLASLGLAVRSLRGFDMFPWAAHVETLAIFEPGGTQ